MKNPKRQTPNAKEKRQKQPEGGKFCSWVFVWRLATGVWSLMIIQ
ncbi:MAG TPA: hypothetical protein VIM71_13150 [Lacunisphaera sp.]